MGSDNLARSAELDRLLGADQLARPLFPLAADGTAGRRDPSPVWDDWYVMSLPRRRRLVRYMAPAGSEHDRSPGLTPDDMADMIGAGSIAEALERWAQACEMARPAAGGWDEIDAAEWEAAAAQSEADAELYGPAELAFRWGISVPALHQRLSRTRRGIGDYCPLPDLILSRVPIWTGETIRVWEEHAA